MTRQARLPKTGGSSGGGGGGRGRGGSRRGGGASTSRTPSAPADFDDAMQEGVEYEEKGERFRLGDKARRNFEQAYRLYTHASTLRPSSADGLYNAARVQYLLGTEFYPPPQSTAALVDSVLLYRRALDLAPAMAAGTLPSPFTLDVLTNLATALHSLAELVQDIGWLDQHAPLGLADPPHPLLLLNEAATLFTQAVEGQVAIVADDQAATGDEAQSQSQSQSQSQAGDEEEAGYTTSLVTVATCIDTLLSLSNCLLTQLTLEGEDGGEAGARAHEVLQRAQAMLSHPDELTDASERAEKAGEVERAQLGLAVARATHPSASTSTGSGSGSGSGGSAVDLTLLENQVLALSPASSEEVGTLCDLGDAALSLAYHSSRRWELATHATRCFTTALERTPAVLGGTSRTRGSIFTSLASASLLRAHSPQDASTVPQLLTNARVYARRAIADLGLTWTLAANPVRPNPTPLPHGGWDALRTDSDAIFTLARALWSQNPASQELEPLLKATKALAASGPAFQLAYASFPTSTPTGTHRFVQDLVADYGALSQDEQAFWQQWAAAVDSA